MSDLEVFLDAVMACKEEDGRDVEGSHADIDGLVEEALRAVVDGLPDATAMATAAVSLLDTEEERGWNRWYA